MKRLQIEDRMINKGFIAGDFEEDFTRDFFSLRGIEQSYEIGVNINSAFQTALLNQAALRGNKAAFTLAEVLITLGIIGVVAAITMPVLLTNVQNRVKAKRVENIKQKLSKVTDKMAVQSGLIGYGTTAAFVNEMLKHMKVAKVCDNNHIADCWPTAEVDLNKDGKMWDISKTKNAKTLQIGKDIRDSWDDTMAIVTADGVPMILSYKKDCDFDVDKSGLIFNKDSAMSNSMGCLSGVFDWNGGKNPNKLGDDVMTIGKAAGLGNECVVEIGNTCFAAAATPSPLSKSECEAQKDKLGIKGCEWDVDYWAGAVAECGGVENLPTPDELTNLAKELYGKSSFSPDGSSYVRAYMDINKATALGFSFTGPHFGFEIWSGDEPYESYYGYLHAFRDDYLYLHYKDYRGDSGVSTICVSR